MAIIQQGNGETIIFIHGLAGKKSVFKREIDYFSKYYKVIAYDYIGHGDNTNDKEFNVDNLVDELYQLFKVTNTQMAHLCCLCFGGIIANIFASKHPSMVKSICHIGGSINGDNKYTKTFRDILEHSKNNSHDDLIKFYTLKFYEGDTHANEQKSIMFKYASIVSPEIMCNAINIRVNCDMKRSLKDIDKPILYVFGEYDELFLTCIPEIAKTVKNVDIYILDKASHVAHLQRPELFKNVYSEFLERLKINIVAV